MSADSLPYGAFHRRVVAIPEKGRVRAAMEDEGHRLEVALTHDGVRVTAIEAITRRVPWTTCPGAVDKVKELVGVPLQRMNKSTGRDAKEHCTHLFDLVRIAIARAAVNAPVQYDVAVPDRIEKETRAEILRDGKFYIAWHLRGNTVTGPDPFTGHKLHGPPMWPAELDDDTIEAALVMRRAIFVSSVRAPDVAEARNRLLPDAALTTMIKDAGRLGHCFTYQADIFDDAVPHYNWRNYAEHRDELLSGFPGVRTLAQMARS